MALTNLTRKHGFKLLPTVACTVEECASAVAKLIGRRSIVSAGRMNKAVVIFVDEIQKVFEIHKEFVVAKKVVIKDTLSQSLSPQ
ncbi:uncharacterized protein LOC117939040 [Tachysurus ichikawai]